MFIVVFVVFQKDHMQQLELASGQILQIKTLAKDPPLFGEHCIVFTWFYE